MRGRNAVVLLLAVATVTCKGARSASHPPAAPGPDEVKSFLSKVAAASADEGELRKFFEGGGSYPANDLAMIKSTEFWTLRPAPRVKRLGPDAFQINFVPSEAPQTGGAVSVSWRVTLPVRRGKDGQLRVLSRKETERLQKLPVPEEPQGETLALDYPDEGSLGRQAGTHYATELRATVQGDTVRLSLRFDPPLTGPGLTTVRPVKADFGLGDEIRLEIAIDADANAATGFRMDEAYRRIHEAEKGVHDRTMEIKAWQGFGLDKLLILEGKKFVQGDGVRAWGLRATLSNEAHESAGVGMVRYNREVVLEKTLADPEIEVRDDLLTLTVPAALLPMKAGASYRVMLQNNGGYAREKKARSATVAGASG
jgi:hypothetical protein